MNSLMVETTKHTNVDHRCIYNGAVFDTNVGLEPRIYFIFTARAMLALQALY